MNSTSACDRGGSLAVVEGGSFFVGCPGAPGCTTTGGGPLCRACTAAGAFTAKIKTSASVQMGRGLRLPEIPNIFLNGMLTLQRFSRGKRDFLANVQFFSILHGSHTGRRLKRFLELLGCISIFLPFDHLRVLPCE